MSKKQDLSEFHDVTNLLTNVELDDNTHKDQIYNRLKFKIETGTIQRFNTKKDGVYMKNNKWKSIAVTAAVMVLLFGTFSTTSFAQDMIQSILARFQVGNMEITQYDKELPDTGVNHTDVKVQGNESQGNQIEAPQQMTLKEARVAMDIDFPAPTWLSENYQFLNSVLHGEKMIEIQYEKKGEFISLLISRGANNAISTSEEVKTETIDGKKVYFANGIVIWEYEGFTYELYQMAEENFDTDAIRKIINSLSTENK
ncbi:hypothetical protein SAMN05661091_2554 [Paenibacillus uliginis N3/975]|uniref:DUF4367 domain-containing protein n=1 Tax=Paenibacillus uliginis N3/975 TaxID=1313296 RepID=A0A1X7HEP6_9BACL|nr:hypothetical protein [Paenibacillus uliginis]SMF84220.1 hypothetical protein SAMN05661091_2554 [Paenibacillus uliginis N3/975]